MTTRSVARSRKESSKTLRCVNNGKNIKKEKRCKRALTRSKELQPAPSTILLQRLYVTCENVFRTGGAADLLVSDVHTLKLILGQSFLLSIVVILAIEIVKLEKIHTLIFFFYYDLFSFL